MQRIKKTIILALFAVSLTGTAVAAVQQDDSLRFEILMTSQMLKQAKINPQFINAMEITPDRHILLASSTQFYLLGWGGFVPLGQKTAGIRAFAFTPDSLLTVIRNGEASWFDGKGSMKKLYSLPVPSMGIASGKKSVYIFGQNPASSVNTVYMVSPGGRYALLFEVDAPVASLEESGDSLLFACANMACSFSMKTGKHRVLATLAKEKKVLSVTADPATGRVYFSTDKEIYAVNDTCSVTVSDKTGGLVRFFDGGLIVFDPARQFLVRIAGIEQEVAMARPPVREEKKVTSPGVLDNAGVIRLLNSGLTDGIIIGVIQRSTVDFDLSVDGMINLSAEGVSSEVIMEMRRAMKKQSLQQIK